MTKSQTESHHDQPHRNPSQADEILAALEAGDRLTQRIASQRFGCDRLGARIHELRAGGKDIRADRTKVKKASGKAAYIATYYID